MSQRYNANTKRPKANKNRLRIKKINTFCRKIQQRASGPGESAAGFTYLSMRIHSKSWRIFPPKSCRNFTKWFKKGRSWDIEVKVGVEATC